VQKPISSFPEDDFDLELHKRRMLMRKRRKQRKSTNGELKAKLLRATQKIRVRNLRSEVGTNSLRSEKLASLLALSKEIEEDAKFYKYKGGSSFDLNGFKKVVLTQKRENFWRRNARLFSVLSTLIMLVLFVVAFYVYTYAAHLIASLPFVR
jgi:hypothetical protein